MSCCLSSTPPGCSQKEREAAREKAWKDYLARGGNEKATVMFVAVHGVMPNIDADDAKDYLGSPLKDPSKTADPNRGVGVI